MSKSNGSNGSNGKGRFAVARQYAGIKPGQAEKREKLNAVVELWARHCRPDEIRAAMKAKWGMSGPATNRYIRAARARVVQVSEVPIEELVAKSYATYARIVKDPKATNHEKIAAQKAIDDLFSLPKARKVALTTKEGEDVLQGVVDRLSPEQLEAYDQIAKLVEDAERGEIVTPQALQRPTTTHQQHHQRANTP